METKMPQEILANAPVKKTFTREDPTDQNSAPDIGPGAIADASVEGGPAFALSASEWLAIQTYVVDALALPITMDAFMTSLGAGAPENTDDFTQLVQAYKTINGNVSTWQKDTFPSSVSLASDIYNYAAEVPTYYKPILPLAQRLTTNPDDQKTIGELTAILELLSKKSNENHDKAAAVATKIQAFADLTVADRTTLSGTDGKSGLRKYYDGKYGDTSEDVRSITEKLKSEGEVLDAANAEYNYDVIVASTTPTYAWVFPYGTIAAVIVAGVYGDKAIRALQNVRAAEEQIHSLSDTLAADAKLMIAVNSAETGISNILEPLNAALPIIQKIQGVWRAISDDLQNITNLIKENIQDALPIIMNLGVEDAISSWTQVGKAADAYRINAYITVKNN